MINMPIYRRYQVIHFTFVSFLKQNWIDHLWSRCTRFQMTKSGLQVLQMGLHFTIWAASTVNVGLLSLSVFVWRERKQHPHSIFNLLWYFLMSELSYSNRNCCCVMWDWIYSAHTTHQSHASSCLADNARLVLTANNSSLTLLLL